MGLHPSWRFLTKLPQFLSSLLPRSIPYTGQGEDLFAPSHAHAIRPSARVPSSSSTPDRLSLATTATSFWAMPGLFGDDPSSCGEQADIISAALAAPTFRYGFALVPSPSAADIASADTLPHLLPELGRKLVSSPAFLSASFFAAPEHLFTLRPSTSPTLPATWEMVPLPPVPLCLLAFAAPSSDSPHPSFHFVREEPDQFTRCSSPLPLLPLTCAGTFIVPNTPYSRPAAIVALATARGDAPPPRTPLFRRPLGPSCCLSVRMTQRPSMRSAPPVSR